MRAGIVNWETHIYHMFCRRILRKLQMPKFPGLPGVPDEERDQETKPHWQDPYHRRRGLIL